MVSLNLLSHTSVDRSLSAFLEICHAFNHNSLLKVTWINVYRLRLDIWGRVSQHIWCIWSKFPADLRRKSYTLGQMDFVNHQRNKSPLKGMIIDYYEPGQIYLYYRALTQCSNCHFGCKVLKIKERLNDMYSWPKLVNLEKQFVVFNYQSDRILY